jgi:hypothetical protein
LSKYFQISDGIIYSESSEIIIFISNSNSSNISPCRIHVIELTENPINEFRRSENKRYSSLDASVLIKERDCKERKKMEIVKRGDACDEMCSGVF